MLFGEAINLSGPSDSEKESMKRKRNIIEVWNLPSQPSKRFELVKYTPPPSAYIKKKDIVSVGGGEEFDKEDRFITIYL